MWLLFLTLGKSNPEKHYKGIKFLLKSKRPQLPACIAAYTSVEQELLMPFAEEGAMGCQFGNKYKSLIALNTERYLKSASEKKYSHLESAIANIQQN